MPGCITTFKMVCPPKRLLQNHSLLPPLSLAGSRMTASLWSSAVAPALTLTASPVGGVGGRAQTVLVVGAGARKTHLLGGREVQEAVL